jgi:uncharacterized protein (TIGR03067 family)
MRGVSAGLLVLALAAPAAGQGAPKRELAELQGTWTLVSIAAKGEERRRLVDNEPRLVIKGDRVRYAGEPLATLKVDAETTPKCIDLHFLSPAQDYEGVYKVEKDTLTICVSMPTEGAKERPLDFETKDKEGRRLLVFRREKAGGDGPAGGMGWLGVQIRKEDDKVAVADVFEGSPAKKAGLKKDDLLLKVGDEEASDLQGVVRMIQRARPGSELVFLIKRAGKEERIKAKIGVFPFQFLLL